MQHTHEMEKALQQSHGMSYAEYQQNLDLRIKVEESREKSYQISTAIANEANR
ncbi:hypothetical protein JOD43_000568 [Pullulanibacillus pueri]|uniref:Uncharacterized protein n=1 Tax=Pullulanibacillus pueri TaxID=1437324 RepID=A0A8J2ZS04_9BACL|nr:hypothetical protein [Pullulanibacillus pueri]MBM7680409.1 hypothetical protein [Pullulanibacillus pueri]GGH75219.1 hypothetical protein GCM10007096_04220 [Pullulanibacillus pueri]